MFLVRFDGVGGASHFDSGIEAQQGRGLCASRFRLRPGGLRGIPVLADGVFWNCMGVNGDRGENIADEAKDGDPSTKGRAFVLVDVPGTAHPVHAYYFGVAYNRRVTVRCDNEAPDVVVRVIGGKLVGDHRRKKGEIIEDRARKGWGEGNGGAIITPFKLRDNKAVEFEGGKKLGGQLATAALNFDVIVIMQPRGDCF